MRVKPKPLYASKRTLALFGFVMCAVVTAIYGWVSHRRSQRAEWLQAQVQILEFRTKLTIVTESTRGSAAEYQAEAHVLYQVGGSAYDPWLPILSPATSPKFLQVELAQLKKQSCFVHWEPLHPDHAFLTCQWSINPP